MITYGGLPLLLEDPGGVLDAWLEQYQPPDDLRPFAGSPALHSERREHRTDSPTSSGMPQPNDPEPPRFKLNSLYWPTGASRWARFFGLIDSVSLATLNATLAGGNEALPLVLTDQEASIAITANLWTVEARAVSATIGGLGLYLLVLVDDRYFWQTNNTGELDVAIWNTEEPTTWAVVYEQLGAALGTTINADTVSAAYGLPDPVELTRPCENIAVLLDAVAHSVGQRIVRTPAGQVNAVGWSTSSTIVSDNLGVGADIGGPMAGGIFTASGPSQVVVTFQRYYQGAIDPTGQLYPADGGMPGYSGGPQSEEWVKTIHSAALADFSNAESLFEATEPQNAGEVQELATQIASDYAASIGLRYDNTYPSLVNWTPSGFDDHIEWCFGRRQAVSESDEVAQRLNLPDRAAYQAYTRVQCRPLNFGEEEQLSQFADTPVYPNPTMFRSTSALTVSGEDSVPASATAVHRWFNPVTQEFQDTTNELTLWDSLNEYPLTPEEIGWARFAPDSLRWELLSVDNRFVRAELNADLAKGGTAEATIWIDDEPTSLIIPVAEWNTGAIKQGTKIYGRWEKQSLLWDVIGAGSQPVLGRVLADCPNNESVEVRVYSVPQGGSQGEETQSNSIITAFNKNAGFIPGPIGSQLGAWVWCQDDGDGYYISSWEMGNLFIGLVQPTEGLAGASVGLHWPVTGGGFGSVDVWIQPSDQALLPRSNQTTLPTVAAALRLCPVLDYEVVTLKWTGSIFTVDGTEFQGGLWCKNVSASPVGKGLAATDGSLSVDMGAGYLALFGIESRITSRLGDFPGGKQGWLSWNSQYGGIVAAEC